eukprot:scaffold6052_cov118-Cylindrotheca_fusiformis.AAC.8
MERRNRNRSSVASSNDSSLPMDFGYGHPSGHFGPSPLLPGTSELIEDQGEELFDIAWYGQASVLVLFSCVALAASTLVLTFWICRRIQVRRQELEKEASNDHPYSFF